jgi:hypothetical protein
LKRCSRAHIGLLSRSLRLAPDLVWRQASNADESDGWMPRDRIDDRPCRLATAAEKIGDTDGVGVQELTEDHGEGSPIEVGRGSSASKSTSMATSAPGWDRSISRSRARCSRRIRTSSVGFVGRLDEHESRFSIPAISIRLLSSAPRHGRNDA